MTQAERTIRVFISSTFRDMHAEREELVKRVFPQLRKLCEERGVTWGEVDLRWGITDEQRSEGKVLPICLEEINNCRPYFISLLGERYGWMPEEIPQELIEREPWLSEHREKSVTELEILHGVLNNPEMKGHAYFYFRNPAYINQLPPEQQSEYREESTEEEVKEYGSLEAQKRAETRKQKLIHLKQKIRESTFSVRENFTNASQLGKWVLEDVTVLINKLFPEESKPSPLDREAAEHEAFARSRARVYIGRKQYLDRLDEHAKGDGPPLVILGESGSGKSALLANWALEYKKSHPDELLIMHFIGASSYSTDWAAMLRRFMEEFKRHFDIQQDIPDKPDELRLAFANWLHMASAKGRLVLIIDALNQLEDYSGAWGLSWLPPVIPPNIRLIVSALPGSSLEELKRRDWPTLNLLPLNSDERQRFIAQYLSQYRKTLSPTRLERIVKTPQTENPLYLRTLLEELRLFGEYEKLDQRIDHYLQAKDPYELYQKVLIRWEEDYEGDSDLVGECMSLICASRRGLSESELLDLLGKDGQPLAQAVWSPLFLAAKESLVIRSGLINFFHDYLRDAVRDNYIPTPEHQRTIHLRIADYFEGRQLSNRKVEELPWQLALSQAWDKLYNLLGDLTFFAAAWETNQFEASSYWTQIETQSPLRMTASYKPVVDAPAEYDCDQLWFLANVLSVKGHFIEAMTLKQYLADYFKQTNKNRDLVRILCGQGDILQGWGKLDEAMALFKEAEKISRTLQDRRGLAESLGYQADILTKWGRLEDAMALCKEEEHISCETGDKYGLLDSLCSQSKILQIRGKWGEALALDKEQEKVFRELGDKESLSYCLGNQAVILRDWGKLDEAFALHKAEEKICRELQSNRLPLCLINQALILKDWGQLEKAMEFCKEAEQIYRKSQDKSGLAMSLGHQAIILQLQGNLEEAFVLHKEEEKINRELQTKFELAQCLVHQSNILRDWGKLEDAMALLKESEWIFRALQNKYGLLRSLSNQALILQDGGKLLEAMVLYKEVEKICRELQDKRGLPTTLGNQALILKKWGKLGEALALHKEEERICRELGDIRGLSISLFNQASLLAMDLNKIPEALSLAKKAYKLANDHGLTALLKKINPKLQSILLRNSTKKEDT